MRVTREMLQICGADDDMVEVAIQVNGKLRGTITVARGADESTVSEAALADEAVKRHTDGVEIVKTIYVPDRLLNLVVRS